MEHTLVTVNVDDIIVKYNPRLDAGELATLQESIERVGLLNPITIDVDNVLIAGSRRLQACRNLGRDTIPALRLGVRANSLKGLDIQSDENLCRLSLTNAELNAHIDRKTRFAHRQHERHGVMGAFARIGRWFTFKRH